MGLISFRELREREINCCQANQCKMVAHSQILLSKCAQFRDEGEFIDVRLKVGEDVFAAHRIVLATYSDYFHAMFTDGMESNQEVITLKESISSAAFKVVMDSIYTEKLHVDQESVFEVLTAAVQLRIASVVQQCCDFLKREFIEQRLDLHNYSLLCSVADKLGLRNLKEAAEHKMASMYKDVCESEEFLTHVGADQLIILLSRDDLSAPSEAFIFKSVMQWIKRKKQERMAVAAKVIGAVRLGLVDIKIVIQELDTEEMQQVPEIMMHLHELMKHNYMPSPDSKFAVEKTKPRSMSPVLVAIHPTASLERSGDKKDSRLGGWTHQQPDPHPPQTMVHYFDAETKLWKPMPSVVQISSGPERAAEIRRRGRDEKTRSCFSAEVVGNYMYVAALGSSGYCVYRYHIVNNIWDTLPYCQGRYHPIACLCIVDDYIYAISESDPPQRYSLANNKWQSSGAKLSFFNKSENCSDNYKLNTVTAVVFKSAIYAIHGYERKEIEQQGSSRWVNKPAVVHCFDPAKNEWQRKASTRHPHFGSSLFVVNNRLCVAGGNISDGNDRTKSDNPAPVEVYNERNNTWSVVEQKHIPPNNLGAVEIEGRVYFIINKFPFDSGIRIPPGERYQISLKEWENLAKVSSGAVLCHLPVKRENLKTGEGEGKIKN